MALKTAVKDWRTAKESAWKTFRTAVKACKVPSTVSDNSNSGSEAVGQ